MGSFNFDKLEFEFTCIEVCPSCTKKRIRSYYKECKRLGLISPKSDGSVFVDWDKVQKVYDESTYKTFVFVLVSLGELTKGPNGKFGISNRKEPILNYRGKICHLYFVNADQAKACANALGERVVYRDSNVMSCPG